MTSHFVPAVRLTVALLSLACGGYLTGLGQWWSLPFILVTLLLVWDYLRNGAVWSAFRAFRQGDMERMRRLLAQVRWPQRLSARSIAYYHWLRGVLDALDGRHGAARVHLLVAASGELSSENDRALVQCLLAEVALQGGDREAARQHLRLARNLEHHERVSKLIRSLSGRVEGGDGSSPQTGE